MGCRYGDVPMTRERAVEMCREIEAVLKELGHDISLYPRKKRNSEEYQLIPHRGSKMPPISVMDFVAFLLETRWHADCDSTCPYRQWELTAEGD